MPLRDRFNINKFFASKKTVEHERRRISHSQSSAPGALSHTSTVDERLDDDFDWSAVLQDVPRIPFSEFEVPLGCPVESGGSADIFKTSWLGDGSRGQVALKSHRGFGTKVKIHIVRELATWKLMKHPNILPLLGYTTFNVIGAMPSTVSPWCSKGTIMEFLKDNNSVDTGMKIQLLLQCLQAVQHLHKHGIIHGDIKGNNVLISDSDTALLYDFDISDGWRLDNVNLDELDIVEGTLRWMPPEAFTEETKKSISNDIWSFGCLISEVASGLVPWDRKHGSHVIVAIIQRQFQRPDGLDDQIWAQVLQCCQKQPNDRISLHNLSRNLHALLSFYRGDEDGYIGTLETAQKVVENAQKAFDSVPDELKAAFAAIDNARAHSLVPGENIRMDEFISWAEAITTALDIVENIHPVIQVVTKAVKIAIQAEIVRNENDASVLATKVDMIKMAEILLEIAHVTDITELGPRGSVEVQIKRLVQAAARQVEACTKDCDKYSEMSTLNKWRYAKEWQKKSIKYGETFLKFRTEIAVVLAIRTAGATNRIEAAIRNLSDDVATLTIILTRAIAPGGPLEPRQGIVNAQSANRVEFPAP